MNAFFLLLSFFFHPHFSPEHWQQKAMPGSGGASGHRLLATLLSAHQSGTPVTCRARCLAAAAAPPPSDTARFVSKDRVHLEQEEVGVPLDVAMKHDLVNCFFLLVLLV